MLLLIPRWRCHTAPGAHYRAFVDEPQALLRPRGVFPDADADVTVAALAHRRS